MKARVIFGVCIAWLLAGVVLGGQSALDATIRGGQATPLSVAFIQTLPWIPVTLAAVAVAAWQPFRRGRWLVPALLHSVAAIIMSYIANTITVIAYMASSGSIGNLKTIVSQGMLWGTLNFHITVLVYASGVAMTEAVLYYRNSRARELQVAKLEGQLARAHLQTLNAQIRPHFLFNTLHTIGQMWRSGLSDDADAVLDHLGALFHKVQRSTSQFEVPLSEELDLVRDYLAIETVRFRDRLRTTIDAPAETLDCLVPPLILQPLVENAIRHGISTVSTSGCVSVTAALLGDTLHMTVQDDGPGMHVASSQPGTGTGLRNTRERLAQLYGKRSTLDVQNVATGGAVVRIVIPVGSRERELLASA